MVNFVTCNKFLSYNFQEKSFYKGCTSINYTLSAQLKYFSELKTSLITHINATGSNLHQIKFGHYESKTEVSPLKL